MNHFINVGYANIYRNPTFHSEIDTQVVLGEAVHILNREGDFSQIRCEDGYEGWLHQLQVSESDKIAGIKAQIITSDFSLLYAKPSLQATIVRDAVAGSYVYPIAQKWEWVQVLLPDGIQAWIPEENLTPLPTFSRERLVRYASRFFGVPYIWGGKTSRGLDCSGFTQFVHKMFGIRLRRDAWMQFEDAKVVSDDPLQGESGDLMFFSESGSKVTHVGFCLGNGQLLHARGMVRINSIIKGETLYDEALQNDFVGIRTYL